MRNKFLEAVITKRELEHEKAVREMERDSWRAEAAANMAKHPTEKVVPDPPTKRYVDVDEMRRLHAQGMPAIDIAAELGHHPTTIAERLRNLGLTPHKSRRWSEMAELAADMVKQGCGDKEIADKLGMDYRSVRRWRMRFQQVPGQFLRRRA